MNDGRMPKWVECRRGYDFKMFFSGLIAGLTVCTVALSLAMAFAAGKRCLRDANRPRSRRAVHLRNQLVLHALKVSSQ